jgi:putative transcriptional regulator
MSKEHIFDEGELVKSMHEALAHAKGRLTLRTTRLARPTAKMSATKIANIRRKFKASTPVFAAMLNVAPDTVRGWEKDRRQPSGPALRLLEIASDRPELFVLGGISAPRNKTSRGLTAIKSDLCGGIEKSSQGSYSLKSMVRREPAKV